MLPSHLKAPLRYKVIKAHQASTPEPIELKQGDRVIPGKHFTEDPDWSRWIECETLEGKRGWVPEQYLTLSGETAIVRCDYSAKELTVAQGDDVVSDKVINGWAWAQNTDEEWGWVPLKNLAK